MGKGGRRCTFRQLSVGTPTASRLHSLISPEFSKIYPCLREKFLPVVVASRLHPHPFFDSRSPTHDEVYFGEWQRGLRVETRSFQLRITLLVDAKVSLVFGKQSDKPILNSYYGEHLGNI